MAYSDYGGYAYRNGVRVEERSDCTITPDGDTFGTPGCYPGFAMIAAGLPKEEVEKAISYPRGHAVLGDGPIYLVLYKQSSVSVYRGFELVEWKDQMPPESFKEWADKEGLIHRWFDTDYFLERGIPCAFDVDGVKIEIRWTEEDNYYQYARLTQADGTVWTGFSGYGVGAGFEDGDYGYSTYSREEGLLDLFPAAA